MARYFYNNIPNNPVVVAGRTYAFDIVTRSASVFAATTDEQIADLASIVGSRGIDEISKEDFDKLQAQKKTTHTSLPSRSLSAGQVRDVQQQASRLPVSLADKVAIAYAANDPDKPKPKEEGEAAGAVTLAEVAAQVKKAAPVGSPHPVAKDKRSPK